MKGVDESKKAAKIGGVSIPTFSLLFGAIAALAYQSLSAGVAVFILSFVSGFIALLGFVPVAGPFVYSHFYKTWLEPAAFSLGGIGSGNLLTDFVFYVGMAFSVFYTIISTVLVILVVAALKD